MRTLRFKRVKPSLDVLAICASKLQHYANVMSQIDEHKEISNKFYELSERCHKEINVQSKSIWASS